MSLRVSQSPWWGVWEIPKVPGEVPQSLGSKLSWQCQKVILEESLSCQKVPGANFLYHFISYYIISYHILLYYVTLHYNTLYHIGSSLQDYRDLLHIARLESAVFLWVLQFWCHMLFAAIVILWHNVNGVNARVHGIARRIAKKRLIKNIRLNVQWLWPSKSWNWDFVKISLMRLCDMRLSIETLSLIEVQRGS